MVFHLYNIYNSCQNRTNTAQPYIVHAATADAIAGSDAV